MRKIIGLTIIAVLVFLSGCQYLSIEPTTSAVTTTTTEVTDSITTSVTTAPTDTSATTISSIPTAVITTDATTSMLTTMITTTLPETEATTIVTERYQTIEIYGLNDFHGGAYTDVMMISEIGEYLLDRKASGNGVLVYAHGDMLQGSALSNYYHGLPLIEALNIIGFDAFTIGNHEFDWGIDVIGEYRDGNIENGEADFPILAANIVYSDTLELLPWTVPYQISEVNGVRVGMIGVIGQIQGSISASRLDNITFLDELTTVKKYSKILRDDQDCDIVILSVHNYDSYQNSQFAALTGSERIDAIFNGHTHTSIAGTVSGVPFAQASNYSNSLFTRITLVYDNQLKTVVNYNSAVLGEEYLDDSSSEIDSMLSIYNDDPDFQAYVSHELAVSGGSWWRTDLAPWGASVIRDYAEVDFGVVNGGGFRVTMDYGPVTNGDLVVIYPFDNMIKTCELTGAQLTSFYSSYPYDLYFDDEVSYSGGVLYKNGIPVDPDEYYTVGAVDYVFDSERYIFLDWGENILSTSFYMRELLAQDLENTVGEFDPDNGTSYVPVVPINHYFDISLFKKQYLVV
ncbi:MAG: 5'-nucleotidase C-terminal domain-containing protein [Candidatus Izemoplasmatales bacterium]|nr:5'-nucleotidase C-terminal domain-containing protein [Candidatus Izemoplasmatales bacterium]